MIFIKLSAKISAVFLAIILFGSFGVSAQSSATVLSGIIIDQNGAVIPGVEIRILNVSGTLERKVQTDYEGYFTFPFLPPDEYSLRVQKEGFDTAEISDLLLNEDQTRTLRIELKINPVSETIKVIADTAEIEENTAVSMTFDRKLIENLPLNGNNHQTLIGLTPSVVLTPVNSRNLGQFSVNGQRTNSNYFTVDGVSANFGTTNYDFLGQTGSGSIPAMNIQGGLDNLVSSEAVQEVEIQTLGFAPVFGRTPGAHVSLISRSGGDDFSLSLFENFRNDVFNAKDYFDIEKPPLRFNNFGGSLSGPINFPWIKKENNSGKTFFFLSYESKKFVLPQPTLVTTVPSLEIRSDSVNPVAQAIFNSFPLPNEKDKTNQSPLIETPSATESTLATASFFTESDLFRATYSDPNSAENISLRLDQIINSKISLFGRFNYSPSASENRNPANLSSFSSNNQITRTFTFGSTQAITDKLINEIRVNFSKQNGNTRYDFDGRYGGEIPDQSIFIPTAFDPKKTNYKFKLNGFPNSLEFIYGNFANNEMRQINVVDNLSYVLGSHELKFGFDYRELSPKLAASEFGINYDFNTSESVIKGVADRVFYYNNPNVNTKVLTFSSYLQDSWKVNSRLTLLYGVRWEINPPPTTQEKDSLLTLAAPPDLNKSDQTGLKLAPNGTPYYQTSFNNFAPRFGVTLQLSNNKGRELILRGGFGTFYDLGQAQFNEIASPYSYASELAENLTLPINNYSISLTSNSSTTNNRLSVISASPEYVVPRTYLWNFTAQQSLGANQILSIGYVGAMGRKLQRTLTLELAKPNELDKRFSSSEFSKITYIDNAFSSDYHALQVQFTRRLTNGLQTFANYTWAHSIDDNSSDSNIFTPDSNVLEASNRGNSDFDLRHSFNSGFVYDLPSPNGKSLIAGFLKNWSLSGILFARSGLPFDVKISELNEFGFYNENRRADFTGGSVYIKDATSPTGFRLNADAFAKPVSEEKQGNLGRNSIFGPSAWQMDLGLNKKFKLSEKIGISFRTEVYNVLNRPNFSNPFSNISYSNSGQKIIPSFFGVPTQTMARGYAAAGTTGGVSPIFQVGGARSIQFGLRLNF